MAPVTNLLPLTSSPNSFAHRSTSSVSSACSSRQRQSSRPLSRITTAATGLSNFLRRRSTRSVSQSTTPTNSAVPSLQKQAAPPQSPLSALLPSPASAPHSPAPSIELDGDKVDPTPTQQVKTPPLSADEAHSVRSQCATPNALLLNSPDSLHARLWPSSDSGRSSMSGVNSSASEHHSSSVASKKGVDIGLRKATFVLETESSAASSSTSLVDGPQFESSKALGAERNLGDSTATTATPSRQSTFIATATDPQTSTMPNDTTACAQLEEPREIATPLALEREEESCDTATQGGKPTETSADPPLTYLQERRRSLSIPHPLPTEDPNSIIKNTCADGQSTRKAVGASTALSHQHEPLSSSEKGMPPTLQVGKADPKDSKNTVHYISPETLQRIAAEDSSNGHASDQVPHRRHLPRLLSPRHQENHHHHSGPNGAHKPTEMKHAGLGFHKRGGNISHVLVPIKRLLRVKPRHHHSPPRSQTHFESTAVGPKAKSKTKLLEGTSERGHSSAGPESPVGVGGLRRGNTYHGGATGLSAYGKAAKVIGQGTGGTVRLLEDFHPLSEGPPAGGKSSSDNQVGGLSQSGSSSPPHKAYAVKQFRPRNPREPEREYYKKITSEYCIGSSVQHDNIVETLDIIFEDGHVYEIMEYCPYDLFNIVASGQMSLEECACCFAQLVRGVSYLHSLGIAHRDLKLENCMVTAEGILKVIDFGCAIVFKTPFESEAHLVTGYTGSDPYIAPELHLSSPYDPRASDIWSLGIMLFSIVMAKFPWRAARRDVVDYAAYAHNHNRRTSKAITSFPIKEAHPILAAMLHPDVKKRATIEDILNDEWFKSIPVCKPNAPCASHKHHLGNPLS
ncbi:serine/threonine protein kinase [Dispira parvispora]|uniref:non-specific serine/threonine protein kinase n=1 Tax=Dispira parvispora TaxID=1520584 RepID=A0A9W8E5D1_9FUNG|nr:serine/threonine protein kinase [Dispira parvispora]